MGITMAKKSKVRRTEMSRILKFPGNTFSPNREMGKNRLSPVESRFI